MCDFGNIVWPELSNENPGKALQLPSTDDSLSSDDKKL